MKTSNQKSIVAMVCAALALMVVFCSFSAAGEVQIMPLGDSITKGSASGVPDENKQVSYRKDLWDKFVAAGYDVDFVGSLTNGEFYEPNGFDPNHEGRAGWRDDEIAGNIYNWLTSTPADIVLLHIGTNGLNEGPNDVNDILDEIDRYSEDITVILARIINRQSYSSTTTNFNDNVEAMAQGRIANGDKIILVDMEDGAGIDYNDYDVGGDMWDDLHPYATGYAKMADVWFDALDGILATFNCPAGMISYWKMDEESVPPVVDFYGTNDGVCAAGGCPVPTTGQVGGCMSNSGSSGMGIDIPADVSFDWAAGDSFTIEYWMKQSGIPTENDVIVARDEEVSGTSLHWWLGVQKNTGYPAFQLIPTGGSGQFLAGTVNISDDTWHHCVFVRNAEIGYNHIYIDGAEDVNMAKTYTTGFESATAPLTIGWITIDTKYTYTGLVDEVALYDRALTAQEIGAHYNNGLAGVGYCDNGNTPPAIISTAVTEAAVNEPYLYDVDATGNPAPVYLFQESPNDMTVDTNSGLIEWTPSVANDVNVAVEANNVAGFDIQNFIINVGPASEYPEMTAYWKMNEITSGTYKDSYDSHDGICAGTCPAPYSNGKVKSAQSFDGSTTGIDVNDSNDFDWGSTDDWTVEFWMKKDVPVGSEGTDDNEVIIGRDERNGSVILHWWLGVENTTGVIRFQLPLLEGGYQSIRGPKVDDSKWHHIVAIREGSTENMQLYVDGVDVNSLSSVTTKSFESTANLNIGWLNLPTSYYHYEGLLDEFAIYNRVLTEREILGHYYLARDYGRECSTPVRIMPLGNSITYDNHSGDTRPAGERISYRYPLWDTLTTEGYCFDFVGAVEAGYDIFPDANNAGYPGATADEIANMLDTGETAVAGYPGAPGPYLEYYPADVILLHIGTNDISGSQSTSDIAQEVNDILAEVDEYEQNHDTDVTVILARIINRVGHVCPGGSETTTFNDEVEAIANDRIAQGDKIIILDMECGADIDYHEQPLGDMYDSLHPTDGGYAKMADAWFDVLETFMPVCGPYAPLITSEPVTQAYLDELYSYDVEADGVPEPNFLLIESPNDMDINSVTGLINWMPLAIGDYNVVVEANNVEGYDQQNFVVSVNEAPPFVLRINCGGSTVVDGNTTWQSSAPYVTGGAIHIFNTSSVDTTTNSIAEPVPPLDVYKACRHLSSHTYSFPQVPDGDYVVRIHWIDQVTSPGLREIDYDIEDVRVLEDWDVYTEAGGTFIAIDKEFVVTVSDGNGMKVVSSTDDGDAFESAIEITSLEPAEPNIISTPVTEAVMNEPYEYDVDATGYPAPTYSLTEAPNDMDVNSVTGLINWMPVAVGDFNVVVEANNVEGYDTQNFTITVTAPPVCPNDMISYWKLDDLSIPAILDSYGNNDGTCSGTCPDTNSEGIVGTGFYFDGSEYFTVADDNSLDWANGDSFSIEYWCKFTYVGGDNKVMVGRDENGGIHWWVGCKSSTQKALFVLYDESGTGYSIESTTSINDDSWHHITAVRDADANSLTIYVDGSPENTRSDAVYADNFGAATTLGIGYMAYHGTPGYYYTGLLDEIALYKRVLTPGEITDHWNNGAGKSYCCTDSDGDGICDSVDNCPDNYNPDQNDVDGDGAGDLCDGCPNDPNKTEPGDCGCGVPDTDSDGDGIADCIDNCPDVNNPDQSNSDSDSFGDLCDNCPNEANPGQDDLDSDGVGTACDNCPQTSNSDQSDLDDDGIGDLCECYRANIDGINPVDFEDFAKLALNWLKNESEGDTNLDGVVDSFDLAQVAQHWLENCSYSY